MSHSGKSNFITELALNHILKNDNANELNTKIINCLQSSTHSHFNDIVWRAISHKSIRCLSVLLSSRII